MHLVAYLAVRERLDGLLRGRTGDERVPTCPSWTVREVVAHLAGLCQDWVDGNLDGYASDAWTDAQVRRFDGVPLDRILDSWRSAAAAFGRLADDAVLGPPARWAFGDAITHEADLRGAIGAPRVPPDAVLLALKGSIARWREVLAGRPTLLVTAPDAREWWIGAPSDEHAAVEVSSYDLFRALSGRRSTAQVRAWRWSADPSPFLDAGLPYPFAFAQADIVD